MLTHFNYRGKKPNEAQAQIALLLGFRGNDTLPQDWFELNMRNDPIKHASTISYTIIALLGLQIFLYSKIDKILRFKNKWGLTFFNNEITTLVTVPPNVAKNVNTDNNKFLEHKSLIFGAGQTLIVTGISLAFFVPIAVVRHIARNNLDSINTRNGRMWVYISKVTLPTCYQLVFPLFIILNNPKMRKSLLRDFKETLFWKNMLSLYNFVQNKYFCK